MSALLRIKTHDLWFRPAMDLEELFRRYSGVLVVSEVMGELVFETETFYYRPDEDPLISQTIIAQYSLKYPQWNYPKR